MYEKLTAFLPRFQNTQFGVWIVDQENDGSPEHPIQLPFVDYDKVVNDFVDEVYRFLDENSFMELNRYIEILAKADIKWGTSMSSVDVSGLNGKTVMALIVGAIRAERFCDGALLEFCQDGSMTKWLTRLQQIDQNI